MMRVFRRRTPGTLASAASSGRTTDACISEGVKSHARATTDDARKRDLGVDPEPRRVSEIAPREKERGADA